MLVIVFTWGQRCGVALGRAWRLPSHWTTEKAGFCMCTWGMLPCTDVALSYPSRHGVYRFIQRNFKYKNSFFSSEELSKIGNVSKTTFAGFAFTSTDNYNITRGCSLTTILSVFEESQNVSVTLIGTRVEGCPFFHKISWNNQMFFNPEKIQSNVQRKQ